MLFEKSRFMYQTHAIYSTYSQGVSILISWSLRFSSRENIKDPEGRYIVLQCSLNDKNFLLVNVYVPFPYNDEVLKNVYRKMVQ